MINLGDQEFYHSKAGSDIGNASAKESQQDDDGNKPVSPRQRDTINLQKLAEEQLQEIISYQEN